MISGLKKFVFLGSSGRIGTLLKSVWAEPERSGISLVWQYRSQVESDEATLLWPDLADPAPLIKYQTESGPLEGMFVFCGVTPKVQTGNKTASAPSAMKDNISLVVSALKGASAAGVSRVIVASSSAVYGAGDGRPFLESCDATPSAPYGAAKREMEDTCLKLARKLNLEVCFLRIGNVAGADSLLGNLEQRDRPLTLGIYPNGHGPRRSYIGVETFTQVLTSLALRAEPLPTLLNVGASPPLTMETLLEASGIAWVPNPVAAHPNQDITLNCAELEKVTGAVQSDAHDMIAQWRRAQDIR